MRLLSLSPRLLLMPLAALVCLSEPVSAGNQSGAGWNQAKPKAKVKPKSKAAPAPRAQAAETAPELYPPAPEAPPARRRKKGEPAEPPARPVPEESELMREAPASGQLDEDALIRMAIANSTDLARRRDEVLIARAKIRGAGDFENPELRIGYAWDHDDRLRSAFTETSEQAIFSNEQFSSVENRVNLAPFPYVGNGDTQYRTGNGLESTSRYQTIETKVTPGRYEDVKVTKVYETRVDSSSERQNRDKQSGGTIENEPLDITKKENRRIVEESREVIKHQDDHSRDDQLSLTLRFKLPNWLERRANIQIAAAETSRAESEYLIEEDKVILMVRELYEELTMLENTQRSSVVRAGVYQKYRSEFESANLPELADVTADIRREAGKNKLDQREHRSDIARVREELSAFCGLNQPERIKISDRPTRRLVPVKDLDPDYLASLAYLHRSDLLDLRSRHQLAKAELMGAKAQRIPSLTFIEGGWATSETTGRTGEAEEWGIRAGITLPLFEWTGINKAHKEFEKATEVYSRQIENQQRLIRLEITQSIARIKEATGELGTYEADFAQVKLDAQRSLTETAIDDVKLQKTRYQVDELTSRFEEERHEVWSDYHKAVMALERAIGTRLEKVMTPVMPGSGSGPRPLPGK
ncbi:MAG: TolC family protein [Verrucomicrobiota bacterium]